MSAPTAPVDQMTHARVIEFAQPILGFPEDHEFVLAPVDERGMIFTLRSTRDPRVRFVVVPPGQFFPNYAPHIEPHDVRSLEVGDDAEIQVLAIVSLQKSLADATANLLAPIVLSIETGRAAQIVLSDTELPMHAPLLGAAH